MPFYLLSRCLDFWVGYNCKFYINSIRIIYVYEVGEDESGPGGGLGPYPSLHGAAQICNSELGGGDLSSLIGQTGALLRVRRNLPLIPRRLPAVFLRVLGAGWITWPSFASAG